MAIAEYKLTNSCFRLRTLAACIYPSSQLTNSDISVSRTKHYIHNLMILQYNRLVQSNRDGRKYCRHPKPEHIFKIPIKIVQTATMKVAIIQPSTNLTVRPALAADLRDTYSTHSKPHNT